MNDTLTPRELAEALGCSPRSVKRWIREYGLPADQTWGGYRIHPEDWDTWLADNEHWMRPLAWTALQARLR